MMIDFMNFTVEGVALEMRRRARAEQFVSVVSV
jgi:hypothetical protein